LHTGLLPALRNATGPKPDALVVVANARDTALVAQHLAKQGAALPMLAGEWAATDKLMAFGGRAVEQMLVAQYFDPGSQLPAYRAFVDRFFTRFRREPGFVEVAAHDATVVTLQALAERQRGETLRQALLRVGLFEGLQQTIHLSPTGDAQRNLFMTRVVDGRFVVVG
jgi:branched-chain amino acid transport system substrate-binding protein